MFSYQRHIHVRSSTVSKPQQLHYVFLSYSFGPIHQAMFSLIMKKFQFVSTQLPETKQRTLSNSPNKDTVDKPVQTIMAYLSSGCCLS